MTVEWKCVIVLDGSGTSFPIPPKRAPDWNLIVRLHKGINIAVSRSER